MELILHGCTCITISTKITCITIITNNILK